MKHNVCMCAECENVRRDAARFQYLQNAVPQISQAYFWNFRSRKDQRNAIDFDMKVGEETRKELSR